MYEVLYRLLDCAEIEGFASHDWPVFNPEFRIHVELNGRIQHWSIERNGETKTITASDLMALMADK